MHFWHLLPLHLLHLWHCLFALYSAAAATNIVAATVTSKQHYDIIVAKTDAVTLASQ